MMSVCGCSYNIIVLIILARLDCGQLLPKAWNNGHNVASVDDQRVQNTAYNAQIITRWSHEDELVNGHCSLYARHLWVEFLWGLGELRCFVWEPCWAIIVIINFINHLEILNLTLILKLRDDFGDWFLHLSKYPAKTTDW